MSNYEFAEIERLLAEVLSKLKETHDPQLRRTMLADMRRLLSEADHLIAEGS